MSTEDDILLADGYEDAFLGICVRFGGLRVAAYDYDKCIESLQKSGIHDYEEAVEYFEFNTLGAWVGNATPVFIHRMTLEECHEQEQER
jgi:hypothetical protein